jgi:hypothetical protein
MFAVDSRKAHYAQGMTNSKGIQILTVTSMKGGVGKTTLSAMLARYAIDVAPHPVLVVDLDPQAGISSLLLGGKINGPTIADVLDSETRGTSSVGLFQEAVRPSRYSDQILVVPSGAALARFATTNSPTPPNLLARALRTAPIPENTLVIVDTGTSPGLVRLGIAAASTIVVPIMFSQQTARPTINTLMLASRAAGCRGALAPVGMGKTQWENRELDRWREQLLGDQALVAMGFGVLPPLSHSKAIVRGRWRYGTFPQRFEPFFDALYFLAVDGQRMRSIQDSSEPRSPSAVERSSSGAEIPLSKQKEHFASEGLPHGA